ncbi:sensor histidine kinase [Acanthopleuribacter pedis]|uniref:histidine kinase n=1 Tax=Acanthopleuribacter pedis TaxID=442870 RepID=A0A8J7QRY2_9BACT|nr:HAMP domain-containing sensor histidine kinase [Acanthopleuribacter pedis]MBO1323155.1 HAMP domain-containing histidine kinase [Acanthopleuribacter pedis]
MAGPNLGEGVARNLATMILLSATICVVAVLAFQVQDAVRSHRETAESVLVDYSGLAGRELIRGFAPALGYYGVSPLLRMFRDQTWPELPEPPRLTDLDLSAINNPTMDPAFSLTFCRFDLSDGAFWMRGTHRRATVAAYAAALPAVDYDEGWPFSLLFGADGTTVLAYRRAAEQRFEGVVLDTGMLVPFFDWVLANRRLIPISRVDGFENARLAVQVLSPYGELYRFGREDGAIAAETPFDYGFKEIRVRIAVDTDSAASLIIGGLPRSRLPLLLVLLTLSLLLVGLTLLQIRREHDLAQRQSDSMASISHELRTPLAQIQMFSETLLLDRVRSPEERHRALEIIHAETRRMGDLVDNVIRFAGTLHGMNRPRLTGVAVRSVLAEQVAHFAPMVGAERFQLIAPETLWLRGDLRFVRRMVRNLIDNALKYGPPGEPIQLGAVRRDGRILLWVEDRGEGVPKAERRRIWRRFERLARHRNAAVAGTGIGLWLVRELARCQNARAWVEDGHAGGARFVLAFAAAETGEAQP